MPKTNLDKLKDPYERLNVLIWGTIHTRELDPATVAAAAGFGKTKMYRLKYRPEEWSIAELSRACRFLGLPIDDVRQACIKY